MKMRFILMLLLSCLVSSCGFQLRGDQSLPLPLRVMYVKSSDPYSYFTSSLKKSLQAVGVTLVDKPTDAPATLAIVQTGLTYPASSSGTSSQATIYIVTFRATVEVIDAKGKIIVPPQDVVASSNMVVNAQQPLSSTNQVDTVTRQLQRDVIVQIFDLLSSPQAQQALPNSINKKPAKILHHKHETEPRSARTAA